VGVFLFGVYCLCGPRNHTHAANVGGFLAFLAHVCSPTLGFSCSFHGSPSQVHWFSIVNSLLIVLFLTAMIAMILIRNLHRDIMRYNRVPTDEEKAEEREETGWKVR